MSLSAKARLAQHLAGTTPASMNIISDRAGVSRRLGARARAGRPINATDYLLLCSATGLTAESGVEVKGVSRAGSSIAWWVFGAALFLTRHRLRLDLRTAARTVGVSAATLSRAEAGDSIAIESFLRIVHFMGVPVGSFLCFTENTYCNTLKPNALLETTFLAHQIQSQCLT
jgi:hypothetical protein